jgi:hypothetical protein
MRAAPVLLLGCVIASSAALGAVDEDEPIAALRERISAAAMIVEGEAGRPYPAWDGTDPATIRTYIPFRVTRTLKGDRSVTQMLLRQPGGEVGGVRAAGAVGAEFEPGERAIVFVGDRGAGDGSYEIRGPLDGVYRITPGGGVDGVDIRLGAPAGSFSSKEKAPGTLLTRISLGEFEQLATAAPASAPHAARREPAPASTPSPAPSAPPKLASRPHATTGWVAVFVCLTAVAIAARRRRRR